MMRQCNECNLCCRLVPVKELNKAAGERCQHQRHTGCSIYERRPLPCRAWNCAWLTGDDTGDLRRPDRAHYVIDSYPDFIIATNNKTGETKKIPVVQIWVDPKYPDAHLDPLLRAYIDRRGADGFGALVRYDSKSGRALLPPSLTGNNWIEIDSNFSSTPEHSPSEILDVVREVKP